MISEIISMFEKDQEMDQDQRIREIHLSQLAMCGFKYRYELDNNIRYPFNWKFLIGKNFENAVLNTLKRKFKVDFQKLVTYEVFDTQNNKIMNFIGHIDAVIDNIPIEIKYSNSDIIKDIYRRQLTAYMIAGYYKHGIILIYNYIRNNLNEYNIYLTESDYELLDKNVQAFVENHYVKGIENYLCKFCSNVECPIKKEAIKKEAIK